MKIFIPFSEALVEESGFPIGELVPFQLEYECWRHLGEGESDESQTAVAETRSAELPA
ncbi:MAG: hypothetical protein GWM88_06810 [Pseudomonadales bacterium]|nr:hypothetical protein [Pseudomonadales bacterium]NIX07731.1 hypothetical protein [Pseudomonadales bacterium]